MVMVDSEILFFEVRLEVIVVRIKEEMEMISGWDLEGYSLF